MYEDDNLDLLGSEDAELQDAAGDELDFAETYNRLKPVVDQLDHFAGMRAEKHRLLSDQAPFVRNNPVSVLKGSLGTLLPINGGDKAEVAAWTGDDAETLPVTVVLGNPGNAFDGSIRNRASRPYAIVQFGTRSSLLTVEVDMGLGCQFTIGASMVTIQVVHGVGPITAPASPIVRPLLLSGMISFHPIVRTQQITRTNYSEGNGIGVLHILRIPTFAKSLNILKTTPEDVVIIFQDSAGGACGTFVGSAGTTQDLTPIPIPGDAVTYSAENSTVGNVDADARLIFNLNL